MFQRCRGLSNALDDAFFNLKDLKLVIQEQSIDSNLYAFLIQLICLRYQEAYCVQDIEYKTLRYQVIHSRTISEDFFHLTRRSILQKSSIQTPKFWLALVFNLFSHDFIVQALESSRACWFGFDIQHQLTSNTPSSPTPSLIQVEGSSYYGTEYLWSVHYKSFRDTFLPPGPYPSSFPYINDSHKPGNISSAHRSF